VAFNTGACLGGALDEGFLFFPFFLLAAALIVASCTTTPPPDPAVLYRERLWAEIDSLPESIPELLQPDKPPGPETLLYLKTYDLEPPDPTVNSWYIRLGLLREGQRLRGQTGSGQGSTGPAENGQGLSGQWQNGQGRRGDQSSVAGVVKKSDPDGSGDLRSLDPLPHLYTLPPLGVLVGVPKEGTAGSPYRRDNGRDKGKPADGFKGTVFLVHGYLDHSGSWAPVIKRILREGFIVVALDLPGHGFSGGSRGDIEHFSQYGEAVRRVVEWAERVSPPRPWIAIGHSTGAAAIWMELVRQEKAKQRPDGCVSACWMELVRGEETRHGPGERVSTPFDNVLFLAPLVRSAHWRLSMTLVSLTSWAIPYWKSRTAEDPLFPIPYFPVHWAEQLKEWEGIVGDYPVLYQKGWILQGTDDDVVDHGYSVPFLRSKLPNFQVRYIEDAGHVPYLATPAGERFVREVLEVLRIPP